MIPGARLVAFVASTDLGRAEEFYVGRLGLPIKDKTPFALVLEGQGAELRVTHVPERAPAAYTVLGWDVEDLDAAVVELRQRNIRFLRYDGMEQDDYDAWRTPDGTRVVWFSDPDGNTLSLQHHP